MIKPDEIWGAVRVLITTYDCIDDEIRGFLSENLMRVYEANWN